MNVLLQKILWFYEDFKSENLFFKKIGTQFTMREYLGLSLGIMLSPLKCETKHLCNSKGYFFMPKQVSYFYFLETKLIRR